MAVEAESESKNNSEDSSFLPSFDAVNADVEERQAASEEMRRLYHELGYLDRNCLLPGQVQADGKNWLVRFVKYCIGRTCMFLLYPIVETQNRINVQQANYLRSLLHQMDLLTEENGKLQRELTEIKEKLSI